MHAALATPELNPASAHAVREAGACVERFAAAFNAANLEAMDAELHFPHTVWAGPGNISSALFEGLSSSGWAFTQLESKTPVLASADKVDFLVTYTRRTGTNEVLSTHRNLWVVVRSAGRWGISLRSY
jgi:hypothetical protein